MRHYEKFYLYAYPLPPAPVNASAEGAVVAPPATAALALAVIAQQQVCVVEFPHHLRENQLLWQFVPLVGPGNSYKGVGIRNLDSQTFIRCNTATHGTPDGVGVSMSGLAEDATGWHIGPQRQSTPQRAYFRITADFQRVGGVDYDLTISGGGPWAAGAGVITYLWREQPNQLWGIQPYGL